MVAQQINQPTTHQPTSTPIFWTNILRELIGDSILLLVTWLMLADLVASLLSATQYYIRVRLSFLLYPPTSGGSYFVV